MQMYQKWKNRQANRQTGYSLNGIEFKLKRRTEKEIYDLLVDFINIALESKNYKWEYDGNPYDSSGVLKDTGKLNKDIKHETIGDLLEQYTGDKEATHSSGWGWHYSTYKSGLGSGLEDEVENIVFEKFNTILKELLTNKNEVFKKFILDNNYTIDDYNEMLDNPEDVLIDYDLLSIDGISEIKFELVGELENYYERNFSEFIKEIKLKENLKKEGNKLVDDFMKNNTHNLTDNIARPTIPNMPKSKSKKIGFLNED